MTCISWEQQRSQGWSQDTMKVEEAGSTWEGAVEDSVSVWPEQLRGWNPQFTGREGVILERAGFGEASMVGTVPTGQRALVSKLEMGFLSGCVPIVVLVHRP